uniref:Uncharacterized protein n=1 Tax=Anopheles coluzzii TaxID=1518534 RepID=A0A8W7P7H8_ANOCL
MSLSSQQLLLLSMLGARRSLRRATRNSLTRRFGALDGTEKEVRTHRGEPERKNGAHAKPRLRRVKEFLWPNHATMLPAVDKVCPRRLQTLLRVGPLARWCKGVVAIESVSVAVLGLEFIATRESGEYRRAPCPLFSSEPPSKMEKVIHDDGL